MADATAERPAAGTSAAQPPRRHWLPTVLIGLVALALGLGGGWVIWSGDESGSTRNTLRSDGPGFDTGWTLTGSPMPGGSWNGMLATSANTVLYIGQSRDAMSAFVSSDLTQNWEVADEFPDTAFLEDPDNDPDLRLEHTMLTGLGGGPAGFVAVATLFDGDGPGNGKTPVIAFSADGTSWDLIDADTLPAVPVMSLDDVIGGPTGLVIVGTEPSSRPFVWFSADGRTWTETDLPTFRGGATSVAVDGSRWVALVGEATSPVSPIRAFTTTNGVDWVEVDVAESPPSMVLLPPYAGGAPFAANGDTWVLAQVDGRGAPAVWASTDNAVTWQELDTDGLELAETAFVVRDLATIEAGFLIVGTEELSTGRTGPGEAQFLLFSEDGTTWTRFPAIAEYRQIIAVDDAVLAVDDGGIVHLWHDQQR